MKKLMIMLAAVALVSAVWAEASWSIINGSDYNSYKVYAVMLGKVEMSFDDMAISSVNDYFLDESALSLSGQTTWEGHYALLSSMFAASEIVNGTTSGSDSDLNGDILAASFLVCKDGITAGGDYILTETLYADASAPGVFNFSGMKTLKSGKFNTDAVPEPTSGLLLLIGLAGIALKRKRNKA